MKKKMLCIFYLLLPVLVILTPTAYALPVVEIEDVNIHSDESTTVLVRVNNVTDLGSGIITVLYDPLAVQVTEVTSGSGNALKVEDWNFDNQNGSVKIFALDATASHSGNVTFSAITFHPVSTQQSSTSLDIIIGDLTDYNHYTQIKAEISNGTITILSSGESEHSSSRSGGMGFSGAFSNTNETGTPEYTPSATELKKDDLQAGGGGIAVEPIQDKTMQTPNRNKGGILILCLFAGISVMLIAVQLLKKKEK